MTRLLWLPQVLRAAGLTVHEVSGWRDRGSSTFDPRGIICHATAGSSTSTDAGEIRVLLNGSTSAPPPIAQLYLSRSGAWHVVASGRCNHALQGWGGPLKGYGNTHLIGVEAQNDNRGQPWPAAQLDAYERGVAAICQRMGWTAGRNVAAHREHQPGAKSDPHGIDMSQFRARVGALLAGGLEDDMPLTDADQPVIRAAVHSTQIGRTGVTFAEALDSLRPLPGQIRALQTAVTALAESRPDVDTAAVIAHMEALAAEDRARDEQAAAQRTELAELLRAGQTGELDLDALLRRLAQVIAAGTTPTS